MALEKDVLRDCTLGEAESIISDLFFKKKRGGEYMFQRRINLVQEHFLSTKIKFYENGFLMKLVENFSDPIICWLTLAYRLRMPQMICCAQPKTIWLALGEIYDAKSRYDISTVQFLTFDSQISATGIQWIQEWAERNHTNEEHKMIIYNRLDHELERDPQRVLFELLHMLKFNRNTRESFPAVLKEVNKCSKQLFGSKLTEFYEKTVRPALPKLEEQEPTRALLAGAITMAKGAIPDLDPLNTTTNRLELAFEGSYRYDGNELFLDENELKKLGYKDTGIWSEDSLVGEVNELLVKERELNAKLISLYQMCQTDKTNMVLQIKKFWEERRMNFAGDWSIPWPTRAFYRKVKEVLDQRQVDGRPMPLELKGFIEHYSKKSPKMNPEYKANIKPLNQPPIRIEFNEDRDQMKITVPDDDFDNNEPDDTKEKTKLLKINEETEAMAMDDEQDELFSGNAETEYSFIQGDIIRRKAAAMEEEDC